MPDRDGAPRCSRHAETSAGPCCGLCGRESEDKSGVFIATHLQLHLVGYAECGSGSGGMRVPETRPWVKSVSRSQTVSRDHLPNLPATINRLAWSNLAAQSAEQIAPAAAAIVAVLLLGVAIASLLHNCEPTGPRKSAAR
jgi:hypothetical protein